MGVGLNAGLMLDVTSLKGMRISQVRGLAWLMREQRRVPSTVSSGAMRTQGEKYSAVGATLWI